MKKIGFQTPGIIKRILIITGIIVVFVIIILLTLFADEIKTLRSIETVDEHPLYTMTYHGDYGFDDFLLVGAKNDEDIERFVIKRLLKGVNINLNITSASCTSFAAKNPNGERIYGRNFDFDYSPALLVKTTPDEGYASISMVNLAYLGYDKDYLPETSSSSSFLTLAAPYLPFDGMNEKGVVISLLAVPFVEPPDKPERITINTTTAIRLVLDKAASVEEAMVLLGNYNYYFSGDVGCHYLIADKSGKTVVVEFMDGDVKFVETSEEYQIASNFIMYEGLNIGEGYCEFTRYGIAEERLFETSGILDDSDAMILLEEVAIPDKTQWSVVYNQTTGKVMVSMNMMYDQKFEFNLEMTE